MSIGKGVTKTYNAVGQSLNSAADILRVPIVKPVVVQRFGFIVDNGTDSGTSVIVSLDKRVDTGTDTGRVELDTLQPAATVTQGDGVYKDLAARQELVPGEELIFEVKTVAGVASTAIPFIEVIEYPFAGVAELANMTEVT